LKKDAPSGRSVLQEKRKEKGRFSQPNKLWMRRHPTGLIGPREIGGWLKRKLTVLDLLTGAMGKLSPKRGERQNVLAFIQSWYGGRVLRFNLERALNSLAKLTPEEEHCLITWSLLEKDAELHVGSVAAA
jgi:hypothetical protein